MIPHSRPLPTSQIPLLGYYHDGTCYEVGHTWNPSCIHCFLDLVYNIFFESMRVYAPLYLLSDLMRLSPIKKVLSVTLPNALRSSLFLALNGSGFVGFICLMRRLLRRFYYPISAFVPGVIASVCAILIERKSRRGLLCGFTMSQAVESVYRMLKFRGYITPIPYGEVMLFSIASAVLLPAYRSKEGLHDAIGGILSVLFHPYYPKKITSFVERMRLGPFTMWRHVGYVTIRIALLSLWCYVVGYMAQVAVGLVGSGTIILKRLSRLKKVLLNWYNVRFGIFLAANVGGFKALEALLFLLPVSRCTRMTIAGLIAGISMIAIRSSSLSMYAATKALEVVYMKAVKRGWAKSYYYGDVAIYSIATGFLLHTAFFEAHSMRNSYWQFLNTIAGGRIGQFNWEEIDKFNTQASLKFRPNTESDTNNQNS